MNSKKKLIVKIICFSLILTLLTGCMTVAPDNRSQAVGEFKNLRRVAVTRIPLENPLGPVYRISARSSNAALMVAGQTGIENGFKYFSIIDSDSSQNISGYMYQGTGGVSTSTTYSITVVYTNDESQEVKYNAYECSSMLDGYRFVTKNGEITLWTLFGVTLVGGTAMMCSAVAVDYDDPRGSEKVAGLVIGGGAIMLGSLLFTIPFW